MELKIVILTFLLLELNSILGFYVTKDNPSHVYEIKEDLDTHTLTITNPKPDKPTLREIIYYHIVEKPYEQVITQNTKTPYNGTEKYEASLFTSNNSVNKTNNGITDIEGLIEIKGDSVKYITSTKNFTDEKSLTIKSENKNRTRDLTQNNELYETNTEQNSHSATKYNTTISSVRNDSKSYNAISRIGIPNHNYKEMRQNETDHNTSIGRLKEVTNVKNAEVKSDNSTAGILVQSTEHNNISHKLSSIINNISTILTEHAIHNTNIFRSDNYFNHSTFLENETDKNSGKIYTSSNESTHNKTINKMKVNSSNIIHSDYFNDQMASFKAVGHTNGSNNQIFSAANNYSVIDINNTKVLEPNDLGGKITNSNIVESSNENGLLNFSNINNHTNFFNEFKINSTKVTNNQFSNISISNKYRISQRNESGIRKVLNTYDHKDNDSINAIEVKTNIYIFDIDQIKTESENKNSSHINTIRNSTHNIDYVNNKNKLDMINARYDNYTDNVHVTVINISSKKNESGKYEATANAAAQDSSNEIKIEDVTDYKTKISEMRDSTSQIENHVIHTNNKHNTNINHLENYYSMKVEETSNLRNQSYSKLPTDKDNKTSAEQLINETNDKGEQIKNKSGTNNLISGKMFFRNDTGGHDKNNTIVDSISQMNISNSHITKVVNTSNSLENIDDIYKNTTQSHSTFTDNTEINESNANQNENFGDKSMVSNHALIENSNASKKIAIEKNKSNIIQSNNNYDITNLNKNVTITNSKSYLIFTEKTTTVKDQDYEKLYKNGLNQEYDHGKVIYVYNDYDNPYDGKEGVNFKSRQFTNGHGYQYFYPNPEEQENEQQNTPIDKTYEYINVPKNIKNIEDNISGAVIKSGNKGSNDETGVYTRKYLEKEFNETVNNTKNNEKHKTVVSDKKRLKRGFRTLMSVTEDVAPEDMYKDVMDKVPDRLKRDLRNDGSTYGMSLTGDNGVIWNNFNERKISFDVGKNGNTLEEPRFYNIELDALKTNSNLKYKNQNQENEISDKTFPKNIASESLNSIKTNKGVYQNMMLLSSSQDSHEERRNGAVYYDRNKETYLLSPENVAGTSIDIEDLNEIKINEDDYDKQTSELKEDIEEFNSVKNSREDYYDHIPNQGHILPLMDGRTYGMNLIGGQGKVWNNIKEDELFYHVGQQNPAKRNGRDEDNDKINLKVQAFQSFLRGAPAISESKNMNTRVSLKPKTIKLDTIPTRHGQPKIKPPTAEMTDSVLKQEKKHTQQPPIEITRNYEEINEAEQNKDMTYGMILSRDSGIVWNHLNGDRVSYHVGDKAEITNSKLNKDDDIIDAKIADFHKSLNGEFEDAHSDEKTVTDDGITDPNTEKPVIIKPLTEAPVISLPDSYENEENIPVVIGPTKENPDGKGEKPSKDTEDPADTYGMILDGNNGLVWNDLNGDRVSYHVGDHEYNENYTGSHINAISTENYSAEKQGDETTQLLNEIDKVLDEVDDIIEEMKDSNQPQIEPNNVINEMIDIIKEVFANETAKLEEKINQLNTLSDQINKPKEDIYNLINNAQFQKWLNDWSLSNTENLTNAIDKHIEQEVSKQMDNWLSKFNRTNLEELSSMVNKIEENKETNEDDLEKKRKDCDSKENKSPVSISSDNIYGSSVGNKNVTNIFIFNVNKISDLDKNTVNPVINGTDGNYIFESGDRDMLVDYLEELNDKVDTGSIENQSIGNDKNENISMESYVSNKNNQDLSDKDNTSANLELVSNHLGDETKEEISNEKYTNQIIEPVSDKPKDETKVDSNGENSTHESNEYGSDKPGDETEADLQNENSTDENMELGSDKPEDDAEKDLNEENDTDDNIELSHENLKDETKEDLNEDNVTNENLELVSGKPENEAKEDLDDDNDVKENIEQFSGTSQTETEQGVSDENDTLEPISDIIENETNEENTSEQNEYEEDISQENESENE